MTKEIFLRPLLVDDAAVMFAGLSDERAYRYIPEDPPETVEALRERYVILSSGGTPDGSEVWLNWVIECDGVAAGYTQATVMNGEALVAYHVFPEFWGQGMATRALLLTLQNVFARSDVACARAFVDTRNEASIRLLRKVGFEWVQTVEGADFFKGEKSDEHEFMMRQAGFGADGSVTALGGMA